MKYAFALCSLFLLPLSLQAQELHTDVQGIWKAEVVSVLSLGKRDIPGTGASTETQQLTARILEGARASEVVTFENDFVQLSPGDVFYMNYLVDAEGFTSYSVREPYRMRVLYLLGALFIFSIIAFGGLSGLRALIALGGSLALIVFVLIPLLLAGYPPLLTSIAIATAILALAMLLTHGFSRTTLSALFGTSCALFLTGILATLSVGAARLSGFASDEAVFVNISTGGTLSISGLLLAAILIGAIGVLDDIAITQASAVREIDETSNGTISRKELWQRASRIGRDHVGAVVNTLSLAYVGASLPLLLLFSLSDASSMMLLNQEVFAAEIVRTAVGSIGLILAAPLTTLFAVLLRTPVESKTA